MIVRGVKTMEIRNWVVKRRGLIALHAPRRIDFSAAYFYGYKQPWTLPRGKLIALAEITDVVELDNESWVDLVQRHRQPLPMVDGAYGVLLDNVKLLERPVDCRGKQMFFPITGNILERVLRYAPK
jgi:hypothetical protein